MTVDQALQLIASLSTAARKAVQEGNPVIDLTTELQAADDAAREELESAMAEVQAIIENGKS